jgi:transcriptional regulator with XRE-family HTH domain/Zn-dependent peptidase ImmA (M78 family)
MESSPVDEFYSVLEEEDQKAGRDADLVDLLKNAKEKLGLSQRQLAQALSVNRRTIQRILSREAQKIDLGTFQKIQQFLGVSPDELLDRYNASLESDSLRELEQAKKAGYISREFDLGKLKKEGFISSDRDFDTIEERVTKFFDLSSVYEFGATGQEIPMFSRTEREYANKMLRFWVVSALRQIRTIGNPNPFDRELLKSIIPRLRKLTRDEDKGLLRAARALYSAGVTVVVQGYLTGTQIRGATFLVDNQPAIVLTDYKKRYDTIWFALLHELYHVLKDLDRIEKLKYHITGEEQDLFVSQMSEEDADEFASEFLLPEEKFDYIRKFIDVPEVVRDHAEKWNVHPSIIYGRYAFENDEYGKYEKHRPSVDTATEALRVHPWDKESIAAATESLKEVYSKG